jgi:Icc protein
VTDTNPSSPPFRLVQISDCHLSVDRNKPYRGKSADAGLENLVDQVAGFTPQQILLTGDLSEDGSEASYRRLQACLSEIDAPLCALPGNHDDDALMARYFPRGPWGAPLVLSVGDWKLALLRSSRPGRIDGELSASDIQFLQAELFESCTGHPGQPVMLALHHQPVPVGSPWIDRYKLAGAGDFLNLVETQARIRLVVWGHVHQDFRSSLGNAQMLACPSTAVNSLPLRQKFQQDPAGPACRWFELHADGAMETGLLRA